MHFLITATNSLILHPRKLMPIWILILYTCSTCDLDLVFVGHWSGCSSNRHSLDSDHVVKAETNPASTSQCSLGNDSGRDSPIPPESRYSYDINRHAQWRNTSKESISKTKYKLANSACAPKTTQNQNMNVKIGKSKLVKILQKHCEHTKNYQTSMYW